MEKFWAKHAMGKLCFKHKREALKELFNHLPNTLKSESQFLPEAAKYTGS